MFIRLSPCLLVGYIRLHPPDGGGPDAPRAIVIFGAWLWFTDAAVGSILALIVIDVMFQRLQQHNDGYLFVSPSELERQGVVSAAEKDRIISEQITDWNARPSWESALMGFFNISQPLLIVE